MNRRNFFIFSGIAFCTSLNAVQPVTDTKSYLYIIQSINQTTQLINGMSQQIQTLGGIRTVMDDVKGDINDAKSTLKGSLEALKSAKDNLDKTMNNSEIKSLFDMDAQRTTSSGQGILYKDMAKIFQDGSKKADAGIIKFFGGKEKFQNVLNNQFKLNRALKANSVADFVKAINKPMTSQERKKVKDSALIFNYSNKNNKLRRNSHQRVSAEFVTNEFNKLNFPNEEQKAQKAKDTKKLQRLLKYIGKAKDMRQSIKTTNLVLFEILQLLQKDYKNALSYRSAMVSMYLGNKSGSVLARELQEREKKFNKASMSKSTIYIEDKDTPVSRLKGSNPYYFQFKF